jgi:hypothetical protein
MKRKAKPKPKQPRKPRSAQTHGGIQQRNKLITFQKTRP